MNTETIETRIADYLDDLLDEAERAEVETLIAKHPDLVARVARRHALLYRPYPVAPPPIGIEARVAAVATTPARPVWRTWARYAAVFLAGVLSAWLLQAPNPDADGVPHVKTPPASTPDSVTPTDTDLEPEPVRRDVVFLRRRIR